MDKDLLLKPRLPEDDVDIPGFGVVRVRALSRAEAFRVESAPSLADKERTVIKYGVVVDDSQQLTDADVKRLMDAWPAGDVELVSRRIGELSGLIESAAKEAYKSLRGEPDDGVRVLPSSEAGDDGGSHADGDV